MLQTRTRVFDGTFRTRFQSWCPGLFPGRDTITFRRNDAGIAGVERAFRCAKSDPGVRPIHVRTEEHVRGHVFLCMLADHVEWHMRRRPAPILFGDDDREGARSSGRPRSPRPRSSTLTPTGMLPCIWQVETGKSTITN